MTILYLCIPIAWLFSCIAQCAQPEQTSLFSPPLDLTQIESLSRVHPTDALIRFVESKGIEAIFPSESSYPGISFTLGSAFSSSDWRNVGGIAFEVKNPENHQVIVNIRLDDGRSKGSSQARSGFTKIPAHSSATIVFPMPSTFPGMVLPPAELANSNGKPWDFYGPLPDESDIRSFSLFLSHPKVPTTLYLKSISWLPKPNMQGWVDQYGQNARTNWPGKITSESDFQKQDRSEKDWLHKHPPSSDLDCYGGWSNGPQCAKNKFFRSALVLEGREITPPRRGKPIPAGAHWWLVTPLGHLFFSLGMDCVNYGEETAVRGRESWFQKLPGDPASTARVNFLQLNLQKKYGADWRRLYTQRTLERLKTWGFNTLGNWCDPTFYESHQLSYTKCLGYTHPPKIAPQCRLPDFFHPDFPKLVAGGIARGVGETKNDPWCIGYFVDNELDWDTWENNGLADRGTVARAALSAPAGSPAREELMGELKRKYGSLEALNSAWNIPLKDWNQQLNLSAAQLTPVAHEDAREFLHKIALRYFSVISHELKKLDPDHLYLGCRLNPRPMPVVEAAARYCDVISFNVYEDAIDPGEWDFIRYQGKPAMIGEFHFGAPDRGMFPGRKNRSTQQERAASFAEYVHSVALHPGFVGCHWFQYNDEPIAGRWFDSENYPIGFVSVADNPYSEMISGAKKLNGWVNIARGLSN